MGDVDMLGKATAAVAGRLRGDGLERPEVLARAALEAAGVLGANAQPSPVHQAGEPSMHDLAAGWIADACVNTDAGSAAIKMLEARKAFGLAKYGTALQVSGPRDSRADAADEVADALVYAQQGLEREHRDGNQRGEQWWLSRRDALGYELLALMEGQPS